MTAAFLQEHLDNTLKNSEDIERFLQIPALGAVPAMALPGSGRSLHGLRATERLLGSEFIGMGARAETGRNGNGTAWNRIKMAEGHGLQNNALAEAFHGLRTSVLLSTAKRPPATLLVTSAQQGEGKTTVAANLAASLAQLGDSVLLIDGDLRRPSLHKFFQVTSSTGASEST